MFSIKSGKLFSTLLTILVCAGNASAATIDVAEGKIVEKVDAKREIYVYGDGKKNEYYLNADTQIVEKGKAISFDSLKEGHRVRVTAKKIGKRLDPQQIELLE